MNQPTQEVYQPIAQPIAQPVPQPVPQSAAPVAVQQPTAPAVTQQPTAPAVTQPASAVTDVSIYEQYAEADDGFDDFGQKDRFLAMLHCMQGNSPWAKPSNPKYIEGCIEGDIVSTENNRVFKAAEGVLVIPCAYKRSFMEYEIDDEGSIVSFIREHALDSNVFQYCDKVEIDNKMHWIFKGDNQGHSIVDTAYHYVLVLDETTPLGYYPAAIKFARSKIPSVKEWNTLISKHRIVKINNRLTKLPMFGSIYRLTSVAQHNEENTWMNWKPEFHDYVLNLTNGASLLEAAQLFRSEFLANKTKVDHVADGEDSEVTSSETGYQPVEQPQQPAYAATGTDGETTNSNPFVGQPAQAQQPVTQAQAQPQQSNLPF